MDVRGKEIDLRVTVDNESGDEQPFKPSQGIQGLFENKGSSSKLKNFSMITISNKLSVLVFNPHVTFYTNPDNFSTSLPHTSKNSATVNSWLLLKYVIFSKFQAFSLSVPSAYNALPDFACNMFTDPSRLSSSAIIFMNHFLTTSENKVFSSLGFQSTCYPPLL